MRGRLANFRDFRKGWASDSDYLSNPEWQRLPLNIVPTDSGSVKGRDGFQAFSSALTLDYTINASKLHAATVGVNAADRWLLAVAPASGAGKVYKIDPNTGNITNITAAVSVSLLKHSIVTAEASGGQGPIWAMAGDSGAPGPWQWTGSGNIAAWTAASGTLPEGAFMVHHGNRIWIAGVPANPHRLYWSSLGTNGQTDPRNWSSTPPDDSGFEDFEPGDGQPITGIGIVGPYLLVFKRSKTWLVTDLNTGLARKISDNVGSFAHHAIVNTPYGTFFPSNVGMMVTDGQTISEASQPIRSNWRSQILADAAQGPAEAVFYKDHLYFSATNRAAPGDLLLDYYIPDKSWWRHLVGTSDACVSWAVSPSYDFNEPKLFALGRPGGTNIKVLRAFESGITADDGTNFSWQFQPGFIDFREPNIRKRFTQIRVDSDMNPANITAQAAVSHSTSDASLDQVTWETLASGLPTEARYYTPGYGRALGIKLSGTSANKGEIFGVTVGAIRRAD